MLAIKKRGLLFWLLCGALAMPFWMGCTPRGPRLLLKGERLIREGRYVDAAETLEGAVKDLPQNAQAWNHLGLAYHYAGSYRKAAQAYQQSLSRDRNLAVASYNLGCLELDQKNYPGAIDAFTTHVSLAPQSLQGWLRLGTAQLRLAAQSNVAADRTRQFDAARRSFESALRLGPSAEAHNALGVIQVFRNRPRDALPSFNAALQDQPGYGTALFNLAVLHHQYLNDRKSALQEYRDYLAMSPSRPDLREVESIARQLDTELNPAPPQPKPAPTNAVPPSIVNTAPLVPTNVTARATPSTNATIKVDTNLARATVPPNRLATKPPAVTNVAQATPGRIEIAQLPDDPDIKPARDLPTTVSIPTPGLTNTTVTPPIDRGVDNHGSAKTTEKTGILQKMNPANWFTRKSKTPNTAPLAVPDLPPTRTTNASPAPAPAVVTPIPTPAPQRVVVMPRYKYHAMGRLTAGNRREAEKTFADGVQAQRDGRFPDAVQAYRKSIGSDPTFFEAYYNLGLAAYDAGDLGVSLPAYETSVALRPDSVNARYNFALALQKSNYIQDAVQELEKIVADHPQEARAHLSLGNIYAQQLLQPQLARPHYLKVLETDPRNPQATAIRYWLAANPKS